MRRTHWGAGIRRIAAVGVGLAVSGVMAVGTVPVAVAATPAAGYIAPRDLRAPNCITDREDKGTFYTTVWVTNHCRRYYRIKLVMARGADSRCFSISPGQTRSDRSRGASPYLDRIVLC